MCIDFFYTVNNGEFDSYINPLNELSNDGFGLINRYFQ